MLDLTALDKMLKEVYVEAVRNQVRKDAVLLAELQRTSENIDGGGRFAVIPLMLGYSEAVGARNENDDLPGAKSTRYERINIPIRTNYGSIYVTGHAIRATQNDAGAFVRAVHSEMQNMSEGLKRDVNRQLFADGTGRLAGITAATGSSITVDSTLYIRVGMRVSIVSSTNTLKGVAVNVTAINEATGVITTDVAHTAVWEAGDFLIRENSLNKEITGLATIVNDTNWLLNPAVVPEWRATRIVRGTTPYLSAMQTAYTACERVAGAPNLIVTSYEQRDNFARELTAMRRIVNTLDLKWGQKALEFNDVPLVGDAQCPAGVMYFLNRNHLVITEASDFDWGDVDGKILDKVSGKDAYTAFMYWAANLSTDRRNAHAVITEL